MRACALLVLGSLLWAPSVGRADFGDDEPLPAPSFRLGYTGGLGFIVGDADAATASGETTPLYEVGLGLELRAGIQFTEWLALDVELLAETFLFVGAARAAASVEVAPHRHFAMTFGAGVGSMYIANFLVKSPSADYATGIFRALVRLRDGDHDLVFVLEGQLGQTFAGDVPNGTWVGGGRFAFGILTWL